MERANRNYALVVPFVEVLAALGLRHACITPGSRNTPLSLAFAEQDGVTDWSHHDERSSAFFALGAAKATRAPAAVVCTSGTAAAELLPAAVEARHAGVPLLLLTADRPQELRDVGAPQAVDQVKMFGSAVKWSHEVAGPEAGSALVGYPQALAARAWAAALDDPPGPVHLNFPFREPLVPEPVPGDEPPVLARSQVPEFVPARLHPDERSVAHVASLVGDRRTLVVCGPLDHPEAAPAMTALAAAGDFPLLSDPLSGLRAGTHDLSRVVAHGDVLAAAGLLDRHAPEAVLRFGAPPTSKALNQWLAAHPEVVQVAVEPWGWPDPGASLRTMLRGDPALTASALAKALPGPAPDGWAATWSEADRRAGEALRRVVEEEGFPSEPGVVLAMADSLPPGSTWWVASSMPIRDVDAFVPPLGHPVRILANRGANGIDGFVSSGLGSAASGSSPTYLLAGDLSLVHDLTALATAARLSIPATVVVIDNDGGGVFEFLAQADHPRHFERHFGTPHGLDLAAVAQSMGVDSAAVSEAEDLRRRVASPPDAPRLLVVRTDRKDNVRIHRRAWEAVARSLA